MSGKAESSAPKIKIFTAKSPTALEANVNSFLRRAEMTDGDGEESFKILGISYGVDGGIYSAMVYYFRHPVIW